MPDLLRNMTAIQHHRGPDARDVWIAGSANIGLCHNRLSIIDLSIAGNQPMRSHDSRFVIVFNGEIYNYVELAQELKNLGARFASQSDTEVLLEAYRQWGDGMLPRLRGMYAFAIYDSTDKSLFCARDVLGKKPFVYAETADLFAFASEIPAVRQVPGVDLSFDVDSLAAMLVHNLRHIPDPGTAYRGIKRLRAGHAMRIVAGRIERIWRHWIPEKTSDATTPARLREILEESIRIRMRADVPVGALLSGGVDSSAITALMQRQSKHPVHTYALGLNEYDEDLRRARIAAQAIGTVHREFMFDADEQWELFQRLIAVYGEPIMLLPLLHTHALCRGIRDDGIKVVLNGNGADELFFGYTGHLRTFRISRWLDRLQPFLPLVSPLSSTRVGWMTAKPGEKKAKYYQYLALMDWSSCLSDDAIPALHNQAAEEMRYWGAAQPSGHFIDESNFMGLMVENTHSVTIAGDLPAMMASVEMRSPFLDREMVAFAFSTPAEKKIPDVNNPDWLKAILREAVRDLVPEGLLLAPKRGFGMGIQEADLLRGPWRDHAAAMFEYPKDCGGLFDPIKITALWRQFCAGKGSASRLARLLAVQTWLCQA